MIDPAVHQTLLKGIAIPADQFMQKPYSPAGLCRKIRDILDR